MRSGRLCRGVGRLSDSCGRARKHLHAGLRAALYVALCALALLHATSALAQIAPQLELTLTPTDRVQFAVWVETADGEFKSTLALTYATAKAGIGNRPGAAQMNSGFRWPYGRREGVLPVWAHARLRAEGAQTFKRVIFQNRRSEGFASRTSDDMSRDDYYCLSFTASKSGKDALDAVTCASVFSSDKGRFVTDGDVANQYVEPYEPSPGSGSFRPLGTDSLYPPRRDVTRCVDTYCYDHADVAEFNSHALSVMPELDAVTQATPQGHAPITYRFTLPSDWPTDQDYTLFVEANVEGDYGAGFDANAYPTPKLPDAAWDSWAEDFGYPYRGQPSVVYSLPFRIDNSSSYATREAMGSGALEGEDGELHPVDGRLVSGVEGSGVERLETMGSARLKLEVFRPDPALCAGMEPSPAVQTLRVERYPERVHAHAWATLAFRTPDTPHHIVDYEVLVRVKGGAWDRAFTPDPGEELMPVALDMCHDPANPSQNRCVTMASGEELSVVLANLQQSTHYEVQVTPRDQLCGAIGKAAIASFETPAREFSTVTPCFVATAAYGSPLAGEIGVLRAFRDRQLQNNGLGRALVRAYYTFGPTLAEMIARRPWLRSGVRAMLEPVVGFVRWCST